MHRYLILLLGFLMGGCSVEVASTAATSAANKAQEAKQAQQTLERVQQQLDAAALAAQQRSAEAEKSTGY